MKYLQPILDALEQKIDQAVSSCSSTASINIIYSIYIDDRYHYQMCHEYKLDDKSSIADFDPVKNKIMGYPVYRVSPNDEHPDFKIVVQE